MASFRGLLERVAELTKCIYKRYQLKCVQGYLRTTSYHEEEVEKVYEEVDNLIKDNRAHYNIVVGEFNAEVSRGGTRETCTVPYAKDARNRRGNMLVEFAERHKLRLKTPFSRSYRPDGGRGTLKTGQQRMRLTTS